MADFTALATRYVLADDEAEQRRLAGEAAEGIRSAQRKSAAVLNWAQSINEWMPNGGAEDDGDVITRAKALGFLAATLGVLDSDVLRVEQVEHLIAFFGAMFAIDHKAGILAAATALRCLCGMTHFQAAMGTAVLRHLVQLDDDFRLQTPATRCTIYALVGRLLGDDAVREAVQTAYGAECGILGELLQLCRHERDPDNLLRWFGVLELVLARYEGLSTGVAEAVFKAISDYFPISMRSSAATPAGTTVEDLKTALRACFAASSAVAASVFDFLLQKLDQGDALTVSVKVDILRTMQACVETFPPPDVAATASRLWNSLKYEVRHGEVPESIDGTLRVIQAIAARLAETREPSAALDDFVSLVLADCIADLAHPTYAKQAGQLLISTLQGGQRPFHLAVAPVLAAVQEDLPKAQTVFHVRDLVSFLNSVLAARQRLADGPASFFSTDFHSHDTALLSLLDSVYLGLWNGTLARPLTQDPLVLKPVAQGLAELVRQRGPAGLLLCRPEQCTQVIETLAPQIQSSVGADGDSDVAALASEAMLALRTATSVFPAGYAQLVDRLKTAIQKAESLPSSDLSALRMAMSRMAFIGCSSPPPPAASQKADRLGHFRSLTQALCSALERLLDSKSPFRLSSVVIAGLYLAMLHQRDALAEQGAPEKTKEGASTDFQAYLAEATAIVRRLYLRATTAVQDGTLQLSADFDAWSPISSAPSSASSPVPAQEDQDVYLRQLSDMATFVIRDLDVGQQSAEALNEAPFTLFHPGRPVAKGLFRGQPGRTDVLSRGILKGLWPSVVANIPVSPAAVFDDWDVLDSLPRGTRAIRNGIATIVANKYSASTSGRPENAAAWQAAVAAVAANLDGALTPRQFERLVAFAAGAFARLDKDARPLAGKLAAAPARHAASGGEGGEAMARSLGLLVSPSSSSSAASGDDSSKMDSLAAANHAVVKSVFKQWVYSQVVQPLLSLAFPKAGEQQQEQEQQSSTIYAVAILGLVARMPFSVYEDDVDGTLVRILVAAATTLPAAADVGRALCVLQTVLQHRPAAVQGHLKTLVDVAVDVFGGGKEGSSRRRRAPFCRKQALQLVERLPARFDEHLLLPHEPRLVRALAAACGDPVREIREVAQRARESWRKVA